MKDVNFPLRKIYHAALTGITYNSLAVPNYYKNTPDNTNDKYYIVFGGIDNNDVSTQHKADTDTSMQVTIHSYESNYNDGRACDDIARQIFARLYPDKQTLPDMSADGLQLVSTRLTGDRGNQGYNIQGSQEYVDRVLTFSHHIFHQ